MSTTEPIRSKIELKKFIAYYKSQRPNFRNYCLIQLGLNTALRINDLLHLKWKDVLDEHYEFRKYIEVIEAKTKKKKAIPINKTCQKALIQFMNYESIRVLKLDNYIFYSKKSSAINSPLSRVQAYRIMKEAANATLKNPSHISCHSLRKTFGYYAYKAGANPIILMDIYNHSSFEITKRYIGITQEEKDEIYNNIYN